MSYLRNNGIDATRLSFVGYSKTKPIAENESDKSITVNTKIEFNVKELK